MQFEKISYQRVFNLGNYESVRIGADILINPGEDAKQALNEAKEFVDQWRKENNLYHADSTPDIPIIPKKEVYPSFATQVQDQPTKETLLKHDIQSCTEIKVLESYKFIVKGKPELETIYQSKLKELSHE